MKRIWGSWKTAGLLLTLALLLLVAPAALAGSYNDGLVTWTYSENTTSGMYSPDSATASITGVALNSGVTSVYTLRIPAYVPCGPSYAPVTTIGGFSSIGSVNVDTVVIPRHVTAISDNAFKDCKGIKRVVFDCDGLQTIGYCAFSGLTALTEANLPDSVTSIGPNAFASDPALGGFHIPASATNIGGNAFLNDTGITDIVISSGVHNLEEAVFRGCTGLQSVKLPEGLNNIRLNCFYRCTSLSSVNFPSTLQTIGNAAFLGCALTKVELPAAITRVGNGAFGYNNTITEAIVPSGVLSINPFVDCTALKRFVIGDGVTVCGTSPVIGDTALTELTVTPGNQSFRAIDNVLYNYEVTQLVGMSSALAGDLTLPDTLTSIADFALQKCPYITSVTLPSGLTYVGSSNFMVFPLLTRAVFTGACPEFHSYCFDGTPSTLVVYYPLRYESSWASYAITAKQAYINVTWELGDGTVAATTMENVNANLIAAPADPTRDGYAFAGWYDGAAADALPWDFATRTVSDDITLYAHWTANAYTIAFDPLGGSEVAPITADCDAAVTAPADPTRDGYMFAGWDPAFPATMPAGGLTLTAKWTGNDYTITFDANGGSAVASLTAACSAEIVAPADPTRNGYTFAGWNPAFPSTMPLGGAALTAQWTANPYTITFDVNGGADVAPITADCDAAVAAPDNPTKAGYTFAGWKPAFPATMPAGGLTLTAQWTPKPVEKIVLSTKNSFTVVYKGEAVQLLAAFTPEDACNRTLTWKSSNTGIATVSATGIVTGKRSGTVSITATATDGSKKTASITLKIAAPDTALKLNATSATLYCNGTTSAQKTLQLVATALPSGTVYRGLAYTIASGDAVSVDANGLITAVADGTAVIRATTDRGSVAACTVTVRTFPASLALRTTEKMLTFKQTFDLLAEAVMDGSETALTFKSDNTAVATVSTAGVVKASTAKTGAATITATTKNGIKATCKITVVKVLPAGVLRTAQAGTLAVATPEAALALGLQLAGGGYTTDNASVADVADNGAVTLHGDGNATLNAGSVPYGVQVTSGNLSALTLCESAQLMLVSQEAVSWTVADGTVATIDAQGQLTALQAGTTIATGVTADGRTVAVSITVVKAVALADTPQPTPTAQPTPTPVDPAAMVEPTPTITPMASELTTPTPEPTPEPTAEPTATPAPTPEPETSAP